MPDLLFITDGNIVSKEEALSIMSKETETVKGLQGASPKTGVVEVITKKSGTIIKDLILSPPHLQSDSIPNRVSTKVETEPEFPGGYDAGLKYIAARIHENHDKFTSNDFGACLVKFIVNRDGSVGNVEDSTMKGSQLAQVAVDAAPSKISYLEKQLSFIMFYYQPFFIAFLYPSNNLRSNIK